jgi:hypothetical protein
MDKKGNRGRVDSPFKSLSIFFNRLFPHFVKVSFAGLQYSGNAPFSTASTVRKGKIFTQETAGFVLLESILFQLISLIL